MVMAKKQEQAQNQEQQQAELQAQEQEKAQIQVQPNEVFQRLPQEEQTAIQEIEATESTGKSYRLKNPNTQYTDTKNNWTLAGEQSKPLPKHPTAETYERIKQGFLVEGPRVTEFPEQVGDE